MFDYRLKTHMQGELGPKHPHNHRNVIKIDKGGTADLQFSFTNKPYSFKDVRQLTFIFKYENGMLDYFTFLDEDTGEIDYGSYEAGYEFMWDEITETVWLELKPIITDRYPADKPIAFEIAVKLENDDVVIERQPSLWPIATLYSEIIGGPKQPRSAEYCSQTLVCSTALTCCR